MAKIPLIVKRDKAKEILSLIRNETRVKMLPSKLERYHAYDLSEALILLNEDERDTLYKNLTLPKLSDVFENLDEEKSANYMLVMDKTLVAQIFEMMEPDDAIDIIQELPDDEAVQIMALIDDKKRERIRRLARYHHTTAGSEMNSMFITLDPEMDVKEAMKKLVKHADEVEVIETMFVVDEHSNLLGVVDLKELIVAKHPKKIKNLMRDKYFSVHVDDDIQEVVKDIQKYDTLAMPVLNDHGQIEGVITMYDAMDIIDEEAHDDLSKLAAMSTEYDMRESAFKGARRRFPWLALLLVMNILVTSVLASFEKTLEAVLALALFQPLILGMAGNIGTQSLAVTILGISRETLHSKLNIVRHLTREFLVGLLNGAILGSMAFGTSYLILNITNIGTQPPHLVAMVVGLSVFTALTVSAFLGSVVPIILNSIKIDPAVASGPFITTINDITALVVYFGLATYLLLQIYT